MAPISYGRQYIDNKDIFSVTQSLKKEKLTTGNQVDKFEKKIKKYLKCKYALTCNSGTSALFIAYQALGTNKKTNIIMPAINFVASYRTARFFSSKIYLSDVDPVTGQMTPKNLVECIKKFNLKKIDIVNTMYLGGNPFYIKEFFKLKKKYNFLLLEDSCHAFGAKYYFKNKSFQVGSCKHADISTFSFHPLKTITTGEGGLITMNNVNYYKTAKLVRSHGIERNNDEYWKNKIEIEGMNFRLSDINAALGISQLKKLKTFNYKRRQIAKKYDDFLKQFSDVFTLQKLSKSLTHSYQMYTCLIKPNLRSKFLNYMKQKGVEVSAHFVPPLHKQYYLKKYTRGKLVNTEYLSRSIITLPIYPNLKNSELKFVFKTIKNWYEKK